MKALPSSKPLGRFAARSAKGWTPERRARQAARIRQQRPWQQSTGPRTDSGKARVAMNALRHGCRSRAWRLKARRIRNAIRICASTVLLVRALVLQRDRPAVPGLSATLDFPQGLLRRPGAGIGHGLDGADA